LWPAEPKRSESLHGVHNSRTLNDAEAMFVEESQLHDLSLLWPEIDSTRIMRAIAYPFTPDDRKRSSERIDGRLDREG
jgi:hypothetical protein